MRTSEVEWLVERQVELDHSQSVSLACSRAAQSSLQLGLTGSWPGGGREASVLSF